MTTRRRFLQTASAVSIASTAPPWIARLAAATPAERDRRVLVVVQLGGGNDGLNTVVPYGDDGYARARSTLRLPADDLLRIDDRLALHPRMADAKTLLDDGRLAIVQGVGYPEPDRSHFRSMRVWHTADAADPDGAAYGWLGRSLDRNGAGLGDSDAIYVGAEQPPLALWGRRSSAVSLSRLEDLTLAAPGAAPNSTNGASAAQPDATQPDAVRQTLSAYAAAERLAAQQQAVATAPADYPGGDLGARLRLIASLLRSDASTRVYYASQTGYDTHASQANTHARLLRNLSRALRAFLDDLARDGLADRVVVVAFSEFGRRVAENDSKGTDHGAAGPVLVAGGPVRGGLYGETAPLDELVDGDLPMRVDFRRVYATLLDNWLGVPSAPVLGASYAPLPFV